MAATRNLLQVLAAVVSLALIGWGLSLIGAIEPVFWTTVMTMGLFYIACYAWPGPMTRLVSMPSAFRVDKNLGIESLEMQAVTYASYHTNWFSNTTHAGFIVDGLAWYALAWHFTGPIGIAVLLAWQGYQARSYREPTFGYTLIAVWASIAVLSFLAIRILGDPRAVELSMYSLVAMGLWRFLGHVAEPIPPGVAGNKLFARMGEVEMTPKIVVTAVLGYVAEFAAGLPFRLLNFWVYAVLVKFGFRPDLTIDLTEIESQRDSIHRSGWSGGRSTAHLAARDDD